MANKNRVQLTSNRIGKLTRLIHPILKVLTIHAYIHAYIHRYMHILYIHTCIHTYIHYFDCLAPPCEQRNCTFEGNRAGPVGDLKGGGGGDRGHGIGGALAAIASSPVMVDCSFRNNSAVALMPSLRQG